MANLLPKCLTLIGIGELCECKTQASCVVCLPLCTTIGLYSICTEYSHHVYVPVVIPQKALLWESFTCLGYNGRLGIQLWMLRPMTGYELIIRVRTGTRMPARQGLYRGGKPRTPSPDLLLTPLFSPRCFGTLICTPNAILISN